MLERGKLDRGVVEIVDTESLVPQEHLLRKIDAAVNSNVLYEIVEPLYSEESRRPSIDPVVLFKMVLIQHLYGLPSLCRTTEEAGLNVAYRWFLGYTLREETPHFSTVSYNFWLSASFYGGNRGPDLYVDSERDRGSRISVPESGIH